LVPLSPADQSSPPYRFSALVPAEGSILSDGGAPMMTSFTLPANSLVQGLLRDVFSQPKVTYTARAYLGGTLISSAAATQTDGKFQLSVPSTARGEVIVELAPQSASDPWFIYNKKALTGMSQDLGTATLPAYQVPSPNPVGNTFHVESNDAIPSFVGNAAVRAHTIMSSDALSNTLGFARFWQNTTTDMAGNAKLSLIPGMNDMARTYEVSVVPPPGSPYASTCVEKQILSPTDESTIALSRRTLLGGSVTSALGEPIKGVTIVASRDATSARVCAVSSSTGPTTFTTNADENGYYELYLDPGTYQVDYDPPSGSSAPRLTKPQVDINAGVAQVMLPVQLPAAALIDGDVFDSDDVTPLPNATIRIFEPCAGTGCTDPPLLRAETQTDLRGHFRAVVAAPGSN
jgi:hypothetical protein